MKSVGPSVFIVALTTDRNGVTPGSRNPNGVLWSSTPAKGCRYSSQTTKRIVVASMTRPAPTGRCRPADTPLGPFDGYGPVARLVKTRTPRRSIFSLSRGRPLVVLPQYLRPPLLVRHLLPALGLFRTTLPSLYRALLGHRGPKGGQINPLLLALRLLLLPLVALSHLLHVDRQLMLLGPLFAATFRLLSLPFCI